MEALLYGTGVAPLLCSSVLTLVVIGDGGMPIVPKERLTHTVVTVVQKLWNAKVSAEVVSKMLGTGNPL